MRLGGGGGGAGGVAGGGVAQKGRDGEGEGSLAARMVEDEGDEAGEVEVGGDGGDMDGDDVERQIGEEEVGKQLDRVLVEGVVGGGGGFDHMVKHMEMSVEEAGMEGAVRPIEAAFGDHHACEDGGEAVGERSEGRYVTFGRVGRMRVEMAIQVASCARDARTTSQ